MRVELSIADASDADLARLSEMMLQQAEEKGLAVKLPERRSPYSQSEAMKEANVSRSTLSLLIEAGRLKRVPSMGKVLITAESMRSFQEGRS